MRKGKRTVKRFVAFLTTYLLCFGGFLEYPIFVKAQDASASVIISVEKFSIGKGWITEPDIVPITEGDSVAEVLTWYMEEQGYPLTW